MNIDQMPAGREMDKLISQYAFGNKNFVCRNCEDDWHVVDEQDGITVYIPVPHYSEDIAEAWEIVEKIEPVELPPQICHPLLLQREWWNNEWMATIGATEARANTAPLAICRAALKALGVSV